MYIVKYTHTYNGPRGTIPSSVEVDTALEADTLASGIARIAEIDRVDWTKSDIEFIAPYIDEDRCISVEFISIEEE